MTNYSGYTYRCRTCDNPYNVYPRADGDQSICPACTRKQNKEWYENRYGTINGPVNLDGPIFAETN